MNNKTVLLVDDEKNIVILLKDYLENAGYKTLIAFNGEEAIDVYYENQDSISLVILDIMMPKVDGWTVCREIRKLSKSVYILMLTAREEDYDEVHGFEIGANDYVKKPLKPANLMARINAVFRNEEEVEELIFNSLYLNKNNHIVKVDDKDLNLSPKEYDILLLLLESGGKVLTREELLDKVWGYDYFGGLRTVDTHINRLRSKLGKEADSILTVRGFGYRFEV